MLDKIRNAQSDKELKDLLKVYLVENSKAIRDEILTDLLGKHSPQDVAEDLGLEYTTLYKSLTSSRKQSGFSFPLSKFGDFCREYLNKPAQYLLYKEEKPIQLNILMSKVAETMLAVDKEKREAFLKAAEKALAAQPDKDKFMNDAEYVALFRQRSTEIVQDLGATTPTRNNHVHIQSAARELATTYSSQGPLSFTTTLAAAFKYDVPVDYLLLKDYVTLNTITLRNGDVVKNKRVRRLIAALEQLSEEAKLPIITDILKEAM